MIQQRRGRPRTPNPKKALVTLKFYEDDKNVLEILAHNSGVSIYKYIDRLVHDRINEFRDSKLSSFDSDYDYEESSYYVDEDGSYIEEDYQQ